MLLGNKRFGDIEFFTEIAAQHNTSIAQGAPTPLDESAGLTVPVTHPNNPFAGATSIDIGRFRTVDAGPRGWNIQTDNIRGVFGLRGKLLDRWDWEVAAQRRVVNRSRLAAVRRAGSAPTTCSRKSTPAVTTRSGVPSTRSRRSTRSRPASYARARRT